MVFLKSESPLSIRYSLTHRAAPSIAHSPRALYAPLRQGLSVSARNAVLNAPDREIYANRLHIRAYGQFFFYLFISKQVYSFILNKT